jgi:hypothetical protein
VVVKRQQQLPVVEVRHAGVDLVDTPKLNIDLILAQNRHDRIREVVV